MGTIEYGPQDYESYQRETDPYSSKIKFMQFYIDVLKHFGFSLKSYKVRTKEVYFEDPSNEGAKPTTIKYWDEVLLTHKTVPYDLEFVCTAAKCNVRCGNQLFLTIQNKYIKDIPILEVGASSEVKMQMTIEMFYDLQGNFHLTQMFDAGEEIDRRYHLWGGGNIYPIGLKVEENGYRYEICAVVPFYELNSHRLIDYMYLDCYEYYMADDYTYRAVYQPFQPDYFQQYLYIPSMLENDPEIMGTISKYLLHYPTVEEYASDIIPLRLPNNLTRFTSVVGTLDSYTTGYGFCEYTGTQMYNEETKEWYYEDHAGNTTTHLKNKVGTFMKLPGAYKGKDVYLAKTNLYYCIPFLLDEDEESLKNETTT